MGQNASAPTDSSVWVSKVVTAVKKRSATDAQLVSVTSTLKDGKFIFNGNAGDDSLDVLEAGINAHVVAKKQKLDEELEAAKNHYAFMKKAEGVLKDAKYDYNYNTKTLEEKTQYQSFINDVTRDKWKAFDAVSDLEKKAALLPIQAEMVLIKATMEKRKAEVNSTSL